MSKRWLGCMKIKQSSPIREHCGYNKNVPNYPNQLSVGMMLHGQYTVGKVLGQSGILDGCVCHVRDRLLLHDRQNLQCCVGLHHGR